MTNKINEMTDVEILTEALRWYMGMYGCSPRKCNFDDGYLQFSCNGYTVHEDTARIIAKARDLVDFWE